MKTQPQNFKKKKPRKHIITSINLEKRHRDYLKRNNLEVSAFFRAIIDELIEKEVKNEK